MSKIDTGDRVFHGPTKETWLVAFVDGEHLYYCGWPEGRARLSDCTLVDKATTERRHRLLLDMQHTSGPRGSYARRVLADGFMS